LEGGLPKMILNSLSWFNRQVILVG
jgi:hypothetical protein